MLRGSAARELIVVTGRHRHTQRDFDALTAMRQIDVALLPGLIVKVLPIDRAREQARRRSSEGSAQDPVSRRRSPPSRNRLVGSRLARLLYRA